MKTIFLLGAGFTRGVIGNKAPLTNELMSKIDISSFKEIQKEYERTFPDIEQFFSILDLNLLHFRQTDHARAKDLNEIRDNIVWQIVNQLGIENLNVEDLASYPLLNSFLEKIPRNSCILTLNYDCVLDQGLYQTNRWSPFGGYCYPAFPHTDNENDSKDRIFLLKLHGSCNFKDSQEGQEFFFIEINDRLFPGIHANLNSDPSDKPHVLVMSYLKQFHNGIMGLWRDAISFLREAEKLVIVGCSLREEDGFLRFALYHFGMRKNTENFLIEIVDKGKGNCEKIKEKLIKIVGYPDRQRLNLFHEGLEEYLNRT